MMELKIKALSDKVGRDFPAPHYATDGAAAMDLCACLDEPVTLQPGERRVIPSGIAIALPSKDYVSRSRAAGWASGRASPFQTAWA